MKITRVNFEKSVYAAKELPVPGLPEVAFSGRSNVGKSSLINALLNRRNLARTSGTPGRTQSVNFISVNSAFYFVDLPGYGYARVPASVKHAWAALIERYLQDRPALRLVVIIGDARRTPEAEESDFSRWLTMRGIPYMLVLTKSDKLKKNRKTASLRTWQQQLGTCDAVLFSAKTGEGKADVWNAIAGYVGG